MQISSFREAEAALAPFWNGGRKRPLPTTDYVAQFLDFVGNPQDKVPAIHIAGTSGKTSTAYYCAALLQATGKRVGLLTSPHVRYMSERVQVDLEPLPESVFCAELSRFMQLLEQSDIQLSYAEVLYAFGFWEFARQRVDCMVIEVGVGGMYDPTNVMTRNDKLCIITDIGLDHTNILGTTLSEIASQKAGIIGFNNSVFCYRQDQVIMDEIIARSRQRQADLHIVDSVAASTELQSLPLFQQRNCYLATQAVQWMLREQGIRLTADQRRAAASIRIPGRMEIRQAAGKTLILDGAHNTQKLTALASSIREQYPDSDVAVLVALIDGHEDRSPDDLLAAIQPMAHHVIVTHFAKSAEGWHGSRQTAELITACQAVGVSSFESVPNVARALRALLERPEPVLVVTGSFYLLDHVIRVLDSAAAVDVSASPQPA